jgi:hypothetical protein
MLFSCSASYRASTSAPLFRRFQGEVRRSPLLAPSHRPQYLLWAIEALDRGVPYPSHHGLRSLVALGVGGYLPLVGRELRVPQVLLEFAQVEVAQTARVHAHSPVCSL